MSTVEMKYTGRPVIRFNSRLSAFVMAVKVLFDMSLKLAATPKGESKIFYIINYV